MENACSHTDSMTEVAFEHFLLASMQKFHEACTQIKKSNITPTSCPSWHVVQHPTSRCGEVQTGEGICTMDLCAAHGQTDGFERQHKPGDSTRQCMDCSSGWDAG